MSSYNMFSWRNKEIINTFFGWKMSVYSTVALQIISHVEVLPLLWLLSISKGNQRAEQPWNDRFYEKLINSRYHSVLHLSLWDASLLKINELQRTTKALISLRRRAGWSVPLLFAHVLRWVFSATHHRSNTSRTTFVWIALQWRIIYTQ